MSSTIDYSKYNITSTSQFDDGLSLLKREGYKSEVRKLFKLIDEIIEGEDMYEKEYSRPLKDSPKVYHIHLDGRRTGDIILLYTVDGLDIDLDLKLYNITDHNNLDRQSNKKYINRQSLHDFDVIKNKYSESQIEYAEACYLNIVSDYKFHQLQSEQRTRYTEKYAKDYFDSYECEDSLTYDEFLQLLQYFENIHNKKIFGAIDFSRTVHCSPITKREEQYILNIVNDYGLDVEDAYIETEVDEYGDAYESMFVEVASDDFRSSKLMESEFYSLKSLFNIGFDSARNGFGYFGKTYEFFHYFED